MKMKDFFPEILGQKCGCALYTAKYSTSLRAGQTTTWITYCIFQLM